MNNETHTRTLKVTSKKIKHTNSSLWSLCHSCHCTGAICVAYFWLMHWHYVTDWCHCNWPFHRVIDDSMIVRVFDGKFSSKHIVPIIPKSRTPRSVKITHSLPPITQSVRQIWRWSLITKILKWLFCVLGTNSEKTTDRWATCRWIYTSRCGRWPRHLPPGSVRRLRV